MRKHNPFLLSKGNRKGEQGKTWHPIFCIYNVYFLLDTSPLCIYIVFMNSAEIIKLLKADGWYEVAHKGDHKQFKHPTKPGRVTVTHPRKDFPVGTLKSIERQSGIKLR